MPLAFTDTDFEQFSRFDCRELLRLYDYLVQRLPRRMWMKKIDVATIEAARQG